jgi:hypothetical protein
MSNTEEIIFANKHGRGLTLILRSDRVALIDKVAGERRERHAKLADIAEEIEVTEHRFKRSVIVPVIFFAIFSGIAWGISGPSWLSTALSLVFGFAAGGVLLAIPVVTQPITVARVKDKRGEFLFEFRRYKHVALPFEEFLLHLRRRLRKTAEEKPTSIT